MIGKYELRGEVYLSPPPLLGLGSTSLNSSHASLVTIFQISSDFGPIYFDSPPKTKKT